VVLLRRPEGKTLEDKRELSLPHGVLRTIVAFANTADGSGRRFRHWFMGFRMLS